MQTSRAQLPLALPVPADAVQEKCAELFARSRFLQQKYRNLELLLADPVAGRCMRLCATQLLRPGRRTRGR